LHDISFEKAFSHDSLLKSLQFIPGFINIIDKNLFKEFLRELASLFDIQTAQLKLFSASTLLPDFSSAFYLPAKKAACIRLLINSVFA